ncbi:MAG TPA: PLP-dependent cysteine synthase family protein [Candidatus Bathyarchaeia archaeon]|nr:PLP-dependent cysteine synthase family protein [Candidatus Bathyarchaeia archaeon]
MKRASHVFELIGNTPMVRINKMNPNPNVEIYAKLEGCNPTGSLKDRIALRMIERAEEEGKLTKDKIILEATSGNTGISVAWVAALKGYRCIIVLPESVSDERKKILKVLGADVVFVSTETEAVKKAREIAKNAQYFMTDQFANEMNWKAHFQTTGEEIWEQTEGRITHFVAGIGTSGTIMGVARKLREFKGDIRIVGVQPSRPGSRQQGLLNLRDFCPEICKYDELDEMLMVEDEDAFKTARDLLLKEGLFVGISSGSAMWGAIQKAKEINEGLIVTIFGDSGFKYLSTNLFC